MISKQDIEVLGRFKNHITKNVSKDNSLWLEYEEPLNNLLSLAKKFMECEGLPEKMNYSWKDDPRGMYPSEKYCTEKAIVDNVNHIIVLCQIPYTKLKMELEEKERVIEKLKKELKSPPKWVDQALNEGNGTYKP